MKYAPFLFFHFIITITIQFSELNSQSLEDDLLIYYSWDSTSLDQSGNGFDPSYRRASFVEDRNGNASKAVYFNGVSDYIELPDSYILRPPFPLSFAFWFKLDDLLPEHSVLFDNEFTHSGVKMNVSSSELLGIAFGNARVLRIFQENISHFYPFGSRKVVLCHSCFT